MSHGKGKRRKAPEGLDVSRLPLRVLCPLEEQVIQHKREIERGIAEPRAFRVDDDRAGRPAQDILRAEVAVNQRALGAARRLDQLSQPGGQPRVCPSRCDEIGLEPDVVEDVVGREACGDIAAIGGCGVNAAQRFADPCRVRRIDGPGRELRLPRRIRLGREKFHSEAARVAVLAQEPRNGRRSDLSRDSHPLGFPSIAADGRPPFRRYLELAQAPV